MSHVALRVELSATRLSAVSGQPALDYRAVEVGTVGLEPTISCFQNTRACRYPTSRCSVRTAGFEPAISWPPTRRDNQASLRSVSSTPWGSRTQALPGFVIPAPVHRTGHSRVARVPGAQVDQGALESPSPDFQSGAIPSQLPVQVSCWAPTKKARCLCDTGLLWSSSR